jgi:hypothetical protein
MRGGATMMEGGRRRSAEGPENCHSGRPFVPARLRECYDLTRARVRVAIRRRLRDNFL